MNRTVCVLVISALLMLAVAPVAAQSKSVEVPRRDAEITILPNGDVQVVETWEVKFNGGPFTSAFRAIPLNQVDRIDGWSVSDEEHPFRQVDQGSSQEPYTFEYTSGDGQMKATWFYPATTDQARTFKVAYTLHGALRIDQAGDEFYWTFIESDRQYPIKASRVVLHLPEGFKAGQLKATTSQAGARVVDDRTIEFTGGPFPGGSQWTISAQFPHGIVKADPPAWQVVTQQKSSAQQSGNQEMTAGLEDEVMAKRLAFGVTAVACVGMFVWLWQLQRKNIHFVIWAVILLALGAIFLMAAGVLVGSFLGGVMCLVPLIGFSLPVLKESLARRRGSYVAGSGVSPFPTQRSGDDFRSANWSGEHNFGYRNWGGDSHEISSGSNRDVQSNSGGSSGFD